MGSILVPIARASTQVGFFRDLLVNMQQNEALLMAACCFAHATWLLLGLANEYVHEGETFGKVQMGAYQMGA